MRLEDCKKLADRISTEECRSCFESVIGSYEDRTVDKTEFLGMILELTDRQVMTYEVLENGIRDKIDGYIMNLWNTDSYDEVDSILSIVVNLGLVKTYQKIIDSIKNRENMSMEIYQEIQDCIAENGNDISNPYRFL